MVFPTESIISKFKLFWQYPVITEKTFFEQNKNDQTYLGFPWATIIDKNYNVDVIFNIINSYIKEGIQYYTCCQHIHFRKLISLFKRLNIHTLYTCHKTNIEDKISDIQLKPCPLYAANIEDPNRNTFFQNKDMLTISRKYLYSFQGAYNPRCYLTDIRKNIFNMKHPDNCFIKNIGGWHYENVVYSNKQNIYGELNESQNSSERTNQYNQLLLDSRYSLCPSGSGPNSIRFWESLAVGSIPILLADTLELPAHELWDKAIIRISEKKLEELPNILSNISHEKENNMRKNCVKLYEYYKNNYKNIEVNKERQIVHYCCGSYEKGDFGGVARYDYHILIAFPKRVHFTGPSQKDEMLLFLKNNLDAIIITDNHLACDIPNTHDVILVHHGVAKTHADREPTWNKYWKDLCCSGQEKMLYYRDPLKTKIISISEFCTHEFNKYYFNRYKLFNNTKILHTSELDITCRKLNWNSKPVILGNWSCINKGSIVVSKISEKTHYTFKTLNVKPTKNDNTGIINFNKKKQDIYLESDIFLQISLCEGNSYSTLDALLCGIPVVSTNVGLFFNDVPEDCFVKIEFERRNDIEYVKNRIDYAWENHIEIGRKGREWFLLNCNINDWINKMKKYVLL